MADVTPKLMYEVLRAVQARLAQVDGKLDELNQEMQASPTAQNGMRQEISSVVRNRARKFVASLIAGISSADAAAPVSVDGWR